MKLDELTVQDLVRGLVEDEDGGLRCIHCDQVWEPGEVYPVGGRFFTAGRAARLHLVEEHPHRIADLIGADSKYNTLTENQRRLLCLFAAGMSDKEVAGELGVTPSTVRHQRFMFREKAKQAKLYLAVYQCVFAETTGEGSAIMPIHDHAKMVDQRYVITEQERTHILETAFTSLEPLRLGSFSPKEKKKVVILGRIAQEFQRGRSYTEREVSEVLRPIYPDFATLRRYLIEYGFMARTNDGGKYWLT